jgi:hypothetical protein
MGKAILQLKGYFESLYAEDKARFDARWPDFEGILQAVSSKDQARAEHLLDESLRLYGYGLVESRYADYLTQLRKELHTVGLDQIRKDLTKYHAEEMKSSYKRLTQLTDELTVYIKEKSAEIQEQRIKLAHEPETLMGFAKKKAKESLSLKLFGSVSVGAINLKLSEEKVKIAKNLLFNLLEIMQDLRDRKESTPVELTVAVAFYLQQAFEGQQNALKQYPPGTAGELGDLLKSACKYFYCYQPGAFNAGKEQYETLINTPRPGKG